MSIPDPRADILSLTALYEQDDALRKAAAKIHHTPLGAKLYCEGMLGGARSIMMAMMMKHLPQHTHFVIAQNKEDALYLLHTFQDMFRKEEACISFFPTAQEKKHKGWEEKAEQIFFRTECVHHLLTKERNIVLTYPQALWEGVMPQQDFLSCSLCLKKGEYISYQEVVQHLQKWQFKREDFVYEPGTYAIRGGIMDIYAYGSEYPFRMEWEADEITRMTAFSPDNQRTIQHRESITLHAKTTHKKENRLVPVLDLTDKPKVLWIGKEAELFAHLKKEMPPLVLSEADFSPSYALCTKVFLEENLTHAHALIYKNETELAPSFQRNIPLFVQQLKADKDKGYQICLVSSEENKLLTLADIITQMNANIKLHLLRLHLKNGFIDKTRRIACYVEHEILSRYCAYQQPKIYSKKQAMTEQFLSCLQKGDYVTHIDHGVGIFSGMQKITLNGKEQEALRILYKNKDVLYVSIHSLYKLSKFSSKDAAPPVLHSLGGQAWQKLKERAKARIKHLAIDLIKVYAQRKLKKGYAFSQDTLAQMQLEAAFIYEDTPDQAQATADVKADMQAPYPMDRLICGDVGFGKTEVAIRAAFKAVQDIKQVAMLVPTTVLAFQHYQTFTRRMEGFGVRIAYLSRMKTAKEKKEIQKSLASGEIDIIIGTHALLSKQIVFRDLGLLIIDEEQKFGVSAKESIKAVKQEVDCLTLSATPIPRTLQFSLMGARDLTLMNTPPANRYPVHTEICNFDAALIKNVIYEELKRGGQVFFIHNHIKDMDNIVRLTQHICPDIRLAYAHGKMDATTLETTLMDFINQKYDVLIATNIVESGIDIPNVNTMIINYAQDFGLSDLHQLRGRVGRTDKKAYCYLLVPSMEQLSATAQQKLYAIEEFNTLGSGFQIAMRDLDLRGAGNILGAEQSGFLNEIGMDAYQKLLQEAVQEIRHNNFSENATQIHASAPSIYITEPAVEVDLPVFLPDTYVSNAQERLLIYHRINNVRHLQEAARIKEELNDRFGAIPSAVDDLLRIGFIRKEARYLGIEKIVLKKEVLHIYFVKKSQFPKFYEQNMFQAIIYYLGTLSGKGARVVGNQEGLLVQFSAIRSIEEMEAIIQEMKTHVAIPA